jgi:hypothetical protein
MTPVIFISTEREEMVIGHINLVVLQSRILTIVELRFQIHTQLIVDHIQISVHSWLSCMVTSKSTKKKEIWIAYCFSGRPDPTWPVNKKLIKEFEKIWNSLEPPSEKLLPAPILGCFVRSNDSNREWLVYDGSVTLKTHHGSESRLDRQHIFEELLLSSAPRGILPDFCFKHENS